MCLLITKPAGVHFTFADIDDYFQLNPDGMGIMWADPVDGEVRVVKALPKTSAEAWDLYKRHADERECAIHFRMKTHGHIDLTNCHPYEVFSNDSEYPLYLMHNGVLFNGNDSDTTKSDTWHFINDVIRPALHGREGEFRSPWFRTLIEESIGSSNKFVMVDALGNVETFNERTGVEHKGAWLSNTYAWSAPHTAGNYWAPRSYSGYGDYWDSHAPRAQGEDVSRPAVISQRVDEPDRDTDEFVSWFIDAIQEAGWEDVSYTLTYEEIADFYLEGPEEAWGLLDMVERGSIKEHDLLAEFNKAYSERY